MKFFIVLAAFTLVLQTSDAQNTETKTQNPCSLKTTCHECIQLPTCAWCSQPNFDKHTRCYDASLQSACSQAFIWDPTNIETTKQSDSLTVHRGGSSGQSHKSMRNSTSHSSKGHQEKVVQIQPQRVNIQLRIRESYNLVMEYAQAGDYPVDLYYLMDLSKSMEDDKDKLSTLGNTLAKEMMELTRDFKLGFGSFVDKIVMPYVSMIPKNLEEPCKGCAAPYGFHNVMKLSANTKTFAEEVGNAKVSGNLDAPEGGFDAIMQAVVCRKQIGWRETARRLLVFSTDAGFHYAGDGKLGGIVKPNDGKCHLDHGIYNESIHQDYPSISQINLKVKENAINVIFAVTKEQHHVYSKLSKFIEGSSSGILSNDSSNVVSLIKEQYNKISSSVEMKDNASSIIKVRYQSKCLGDEIMDTNKCSGLKVGDIVKFNIIIEALECPKDPKDWNQRMHIYPVGISEALVVDLQLLCDCPCESITDTSFQHNSTFCGNLGSLRCGQCECISPHFGRRCECGPNKDLNKDRSKGCRPDNKTQSDCSGRGNCVCGSCDCKIRPNHAEIIDGPYCECDNFSCDRNQGVLCSGTDHGVCECGVCKCFDGWIGSACSCPATNDSCLAKGSNLHCSGHGVCDCGVCKCDTKDGGRYSGKYCEMCPTCPDRCSEFDACVACQMFEYPNDITKCPNCTMFTPVPKDKIEADEDKGEVFCTYLDKDHCRVSYKYAYDERGDLEVTVQQEPECPPKVFVLGIVLGVIAAIVLMGLAMLLMWKAITTIHDRREFAKFEKERMMAKWDTGENPIYKQATSTFKNPTYAGK